MGNTVYCRRTGQLCTLCMIGFIPDVLKCANRYKKPDEEDTQNDDHAVSRENIEKLKKRYPEGFDADRSLHREE